MVFYHLLQLKVCFYVHESRLRSVSRLALQPSQVLCYRVISRSLHCERDVSRDVARP